MSYLLAIEAASDACSVALHHDGDTLQRIEHAPRMHSKLLYPMLNELMAEAGIKPLALSGIGFVNGPGSFTGLRIAAATAQGIGYACDLPLYPVSTLQAMAQQRHQQHGDEKVAPLLDARMNEVYLGEYHLQENLMRPVQGDRIMAFDAPAQHWNLTIEPADLVGVGHGYHLDALSKDIVNHLKQVEADQVLEAGSLFPMMLDLVQNNQGIAPEQVELTYLREQTHWKTIKQQKALKS